MCDNRGLIFFLSFAILFSCSTQKTITSKNEERGYYEDLRERDACRYGAYAGK